MQYHKAFPMMPLPLIPVETIIDTTIVDVFNFQKFQLTLLSAVSNYTLFENLSLANSPINLLASNKLNARTKRKTEYFSFLEHPFRQIFTNTRKTSIKMTYPKPTVTAATPPSTAAMTASEQQTGVITRINE